MYRYLNQNNVTCICVGGTCTCIQHEGLWHWHSTSHRSSTCTVSDQDLTSLSHALHLGFIFPWARRSSSILKLIRHQTMCLRTTNRKRRALQDSAWVAAEIASLDHLHSLLFSSSNRHQPSPAQATDWSRAEFLRHQKQSGVVFSSRLMFIPVPKKTG